MERYEPAQPRQGDIGLAVLPGSVGLVREVAEQATVRGEIGTPREDASTKPCAGLAQSLSDEAHSGRLGAFRGYGVASGDAPPSGRARQTPGGEAAGDRHRDRR